jgi:electron transport complex protein RnfB
MAIILVGMLLAGVGGGILAYRAARRRTTGEPLVARIDGVLPQTQCGRCGFPGCRPYAEAIARGDADIDRCPPGGDEGIRSLAALLGVPVKPLNPAHGEVQTKRVAVILEDQCIGCSLCLKACPVDAIVGAPQWMHTVISSECTGCELCVSPCPVDCIEMRPAVSEGTSAGHSVSAHSGSAARESSQSSCQVASVMIEHPRTDSAEVGPCIRCGFCSDVCPSRLAPQQLVWLAGQGKLERAESLRLLDCSECGLCDDVCPSYIPLARQLRDAKQAVLAQRTARAAADHARRRYESRGLRLDRERQLKDDRALRQKEALHKPGAEAVAAAIERARSRKAQMRIGADSLKSVLPDDDLPPDRA